MNHHFPGILWPEELSDFIKTHHESEYTILDVRQPEEYKQGHIPGAKLIPLGELESHLSELVKNQEVICYCASGGRSKVASLMLSENGFKTVKNMIGGIFAYEGQPVIDFPKIQLFEKDAGYEKLLLTAMDLEKGAMHFYKHILNVHAIESISPIILDLSKAEVAHARSIFQIYKNLTGFADNFEVLFDTLTGNILEGGLPIDDMFARIKDIKEFRCLRLLELALEIEYAAFDLYRNVVDLTPEQDSQTVFLNIAQAEKGHMRQITQAISKCASSA